VASSKWKVHGSLKPALWSVTRCLAVDLLQQPDEFVPSRLPAQLGSDLADAIRLFEGPEQALHGRWRFRHSIYAYGQILDGHPKHLDLSNGDRAVGGGSPLLVGRASARLGAPLAWTTAAPADPGGPASRACAPGERSTVLTTVM
jgi:sugar/nucleoside kinase (ribokinase family)